MNVPQGMHALNAEAATKLSHALPVTVPVLQLDASVNADIQQISVAVHIWFTRLDTDKQTKIMF